MLRTFTKISGHFAKNIVRDLTELILPLLLIIHKLLGESTRMMRLHRFDRTFTVCFGFFSSFLKANAQNIDYSQCAIDANQTYLAAPNATFLYDQNGKPTNNISQAWGISYKSCVAMCSSTINTQGYEWSLWFQGLTSWVLPWLALTAQLPFETNDKQTNFMALLLALGSPLLITYSLTLTILNARWINQKFRQIKEENKSLRPHRPLQIKAIKAARAFLIDSQHIPIQIFNGQRREFAQLVACPENWAWWNSLREEIQKTKRGWTYSLYAQIGWVCISQLAAVVTFFTSASFDTSIGIGLAINSLWVWMIPVILGWVYVGTQTSAGSIKTALAKITVPALGPETNVSGECIGIRDRTTFDESCTQLRDPIVHFRRCGSQRQRESSFGKDVESVGSQKDIELTASTHTSTNGSLRPLIEHKRRRNCSSHTFLGFSIAGCDLEPGPIFNYARVWNHMNAVYHVASAFAAFTCRQREKQSVHGQPWDPAPEKYDENLRGSPQELSTYISELGEDKINFSVHGRSSPDLVLNCITAALIAIFLQWGSTGAAVVMAYKTPVVGLGCQSGSYLLYGIIATIAGLLLVLSASLSNQWSLSMETANVDPHWILGPSAVMTRLMGKSLAAANAFFLVVTCVIQFTGLYDTCWCDACIPSLGTEAGWVILFATDAQIEAASRSAWIGGVSLSIVSAAVATFYFFTSRGDEIFRRNTQ